MSFSAVTETFIPELQSVCSYALMEQVTQTAPLLCKNWTARVQARRDDLAI